MEAARVRGVMVPSLSGAWRACAGAILVALAVQRPAAALIKSEDSGLPHTREFVGYAYDQKNGALLYVERHRQEFLGSKLLRGSVVYSDPKGTVIARKTLDYRSNPYAPSFQTEDLRSGGVEAGEFLERKYKVRFRERGKHGMRSRNLDGVKALVADAGFDNYVRARMPDLLRGEDVHFNFVVPSRLEVLHLRAAPMGVERGRDRELLRVRVETDNALLRLFVSPGYLLYDINSGELMEYIGLSNLDDEQVNKYRVRILYPNGQQPGAGGPPPASTAGGS